MFLDLSVKSFEGPILNGSLNYTEVLGLVDLSIRKLSCINN